MSFIDFYLSRNKNKSKSINIPEVQNAAKSLIENQNNKKFKWLKKKVENHISRHNFDTDFSPNDLYKKIIDDVLIASCFAKPVVKQNQSEKLQEEYLKNRGIKVKKLPANGSKSYRFIVGTGEFGQYKKDEDKTTHSMDFICKGKKYLDYIMAKVTTTQGGAQNQQRHEMLNIIKDMDMYIQKNPKTNLRFVLLLDGDNYEQEKVEVFKKYQAERIYITNSDEYIPC